MRTPSLNVAHREQREKGRLVSNVQPISRDTSFASSQPSTILKSLPDTSRSSGDHWRALWKRPFLNTWLAEILALAFSAACLTAIVVVLKVYERKAIPKIPFGLTLNAIISILATGSKSSLLLAVAGAISQLKWSWFATRRRNLDDMQEFDDASRGPWGSVTLLFTINVRSLASVGALVTILTLAYDPFVQQVLQYPVRVVQQPSNETTTTQALMWIPDANTADFGNAISAGIWSDEAAFARNPSCPSGNCNWPLFRSMGWCSKCENITTRVVLDDCPFEDYYDKKVYPLQCNLTYDDNPSISYAWGSMVHTSTYDRFENITRHSSYPGATIVSQVSWPVRTANNDTGPTILGVPNPALVIGFVSLYYITPADAVWNGPNDKIKPSVQHAEQCVLTPCARTYNISTRNGNLREEIIEENYGLQKTYTVKYLNNPVSPFQTQDLFCWQPDPGNLTMEYIVPKGPTGTRAGEYNPWIPTVAERWENTTGSAFCSLPDYQDRLATALNGTVEIDADAMVPGEGQAELWEWLDQYPYSTFGFYTEPTLKSTALQKMRTTNLTTVVHSLAASLTKLGLDLSNVTVYGNVSTTENYVQAEWKWLIFPMALEALGILLLVATIAISHVQHTRLWKSSVLPLLYHGLDDVLQIQAPPQDVFGMEELARGTKVRMMVTDSDSRVVLAT